MKKVSVQMILSDTPTCGCPTCQRVVRNLQEAVFLVRGNNTVAFCGPDCYYQVSQTYLDQRRANQAVAKKNLLTSMGYSPRKEA